ncbi:hypothetical protein C2G38_2152569 [Gigaspora rosea]|uniref:Uncharacterized protein n=1 Tax=Gigaspora rosea TaxID=44941 RepID=A0A397WA92_9GLOM|nr:hypothetical protein C2G38_2152569 [Gigaspora rosea]
MTSTLVTTRTKESENEVKSIMSMKFSPNNPYIEAEQENSHENNGHMEDIEIEDRRISGAIEKGEDQQITVSTNNGMIIADTNMEMDKLETESTGTIEDENGTNPIPTYQHGTQNRRCTEKEAKSTGRYMENYYTE